jgi:hypothetical protein
MSNKKQRTFASCSSAQLSSYEKQSFAKKTEYAIAGAERIFKDFLKTKKIETIPTDKPTVNMLLKEFWPSLRTIKNEEYKASSLLTLRQNLRLVFSMKYQMEIIKDTEMDHNLVFENYLKDLKKRGNGCVTHHREVSTEDLQLIVSKLDINHPQQLQWLTWFYLHLYLCRRGVENSYSLKKTDIIIEQRGITSIIRLKNDETKNHKEVGEDEENGGVICSVPNNLKCPVYVIKTYLNHLHSKCDSLWQRPKASVINPETCWYYNAPVGHNFLKNMLKSISIFCSTSTVYTNHCLRVSSCSLLGVAGYSDLDIQSVSRHKSVSSLGIYKRVKIDKKMKMSDSVSSTIGVRHDVNLPLTSHHQHKDCCLSYGISTQPSSSTSQCVSSIGISSNALPVTPVQELVDTSTEMFDISNDQVLMTEVEATTISTMQNVQLPSPHIGEIFNDINFDQLLLPAVEGSERNLHIQNMFSSCTFNGNLTLNFNSK